MTALSFCWFLLFNAWWLNSDGSTYLGTGRSMLDGLGPRLPDGTTVHWWNRPVYPLLIALPSLFDGGIGASIWMSRLPLMLAAPLVAAGTLRLTRSLPAAAVAGLAALAQPWTLLAGGSNLVPDGTTAVVTVGAVLAACVGVESSTRRARAGWLTGALGCVVVAALTKQTGAVALLLVLIVAWNGMARPPRWQVWAALAVEGAAAFTALVVANGATEVGLVDLPRTFVDRMRIEVFPGSPAIVVAGAISLLLVAWAVPRATRALPLTGLTLTVAGLVLGVYASGNGLQMRNATMLPYGIALLVGALVGERTDSAWWRRPRVWVGVVLIASLVAGAESRAYRTSDITERNWDSGATRGVANFLSSHSAASPIGCTLDYCSFFWLDSNQELRTRLLPQYSARPGADSLAGLVFDHRTGFRGPVSTPAPCRRTALVVTTSDEGFGAVFECALLRYVRAEHPSYLVVSGSGTHDTFDAARVIPYLSSNPAFRLVYSTPISAWPRVVAVYQVVAPPRPVAGAPTYFSQAAYDALPGDHGKPGVTVLDGDCYRRAIAAALAPQSAGQPVQSACSSS